MTHRSAVVATVAALVAGILAFAAATSAPPAPPDSPSFASGSVELARQQLDEALARSADRLRRANEAQASRSEVATTELALSGTARAISPASASGSTAGTDRIAGANRSATSVMVSQDIHTDPDTYFGGVVFIANGMNFPDALAAGPAASSVLGPILLVPPTGGLPADVATEVRRLGADSVVILGKTDNVSARAEADLRAIVPAGEVIRIAGGSRYETSALLAGLVKKWVPTASGEFAPAPPDTVIISTGLTFADALAGGAAGGWEYAPMLLTSPTALHPTVEAVLRPRPAGSGEPGRTFTTVRILGSTATISTAVETRIRAILPQATIVRYAGRDRFDTAAKLNADVFDGPVSEVTLINGFRFPDALVGAALVNVTGGPTIPVRAECIPAHSQSTIITLTPSVRTALGGVDAVSAAALNGSLCPTAQ